MMVVKKWWWGHLSFKEAVGIQLPPWLIQKRSWMWNPFGGIQVKSFQIRGSFITSFLKQLHAFCIEQVIISNNSKLIYVQVKDRISNFIFKHIQTNQRFKRMMIGTHYQLYLHIVKSRTFWCWQGTI